MHNDGSGTGKVGTDVLKKFPYSLIIFISSDFALLLINNK